MIKFFKKIRTWIAAWFRRRPIPLTWERVEEMPDELATNTVYVAGQGDYNWFVAMICPCGCKETLFMNLQGNVRPKWTLTVHGNNTVSLYPSVWRQVGCRTTSICDED